MTHEELRKRAVKWLTNTKHCGVVLSEMVSLCSEIPDAVGWQSGTSYAVECKVSRSDWRANADKQCERTGRGVGSYRYVLCPSRLLTVEDMDGTDYGLLWCSEQSGSLQTIKSPAHRMRCADDEITMLVSALRRVKAREFLVVVPPSEILEPSLEAPNV